MGYWSKRFWEVRDGGTDIDYDYLSHCMKMRYDAWQRSQIPLGLEKASQFLKPASSFSTHFNIICSTALTVICYFPIIFFWYLYFFSYCWSVSYFPIPTRRWEVFLLSTSSVFWLRLVWSELPSHPLINKLKMLVAQLAFSVVPLYYWLSCSINCSKCCVVGSYRCLVKWHYITWTNHNQQLCGQH